MKTLILRGAALVLCFCLLLAALPALSVCARETGTAEDISGTGRITGQEGFGQAAALFDGNLQKPVTLPDHAWATLEYPGGIGSLYLIFHVEYGPYTVTDNATGETVTCGESRFLHDFVDLEALFGEAPVSVTVSFDSGEVQLNELVLYTSGQVPDSVQRWEPPAEGKTDLLLFSAHGDDEQLFFAGLLPYYAGELGYQVQVVYLTDHRNRLDTRCHEMLDGLWAVGVTTYPVFGAFDDFFCRSLADCYSIMKSRGASREELMGFLVEQLRRFRPLVAVTHDIDGEYGHGMHMLCADLMRQAVALSGDPGQYPELADAWGIWEVPKTYLHLYPENGIVLDWDRPLERFGGMTAYQVTKQLGFPCHESQQQDFRWYLSSSETAAGLVKYSPCQYGLYRTTVGPDEAKNDFFENLTTYAQQARLEAEEAERLAAEEAARQAEAEALRRAEEEAARREAEEAARREAEEAALQAEEAARLEAKKAEHLAREQARLEDQTQQKKVLLVAACGTLSGLLAVLLLVLGWRNRKKS